MNERASAPDEAMRTSIRRLLRPKSVAIVGASPTPGSLGGGVLANLARFDYRGDIHLVHPSRAQIEGRPCVPSTLDLPAGVDCAVLAIPVAGVMPALEGCAQRGVGGVIIFSAGFAEASDEGRRRQEALADFARAHSIAIEGPNCLGMINFLDGAPLTFGAADFVPVDRPGVGLVSQSGAMATAVRAALHSRALQVSFSISTGNEAVNGLEDFLEHLLEDEMTRVIGMVAEQIRAPRRFLELAARARTTGKPIVLLHPGRSRAAQQSAQTHTGAMTGDYDVMRTLVAREGVAIVETLEELTDLCELFMRCGAPPSAGAAVLTESGAHKGLVLDYCESIGLSLPEPAGATEQALAALAPGLIGATNPLDITAQALVDPGLYAKSLAPLMADPSYGSVVLAIICSNPTMSARKLPPIIEAVRRCGGGKPILFAMLGEEALVPPELIAELRDLGVPFFRSPERALRALARLTEIGMRQARAGSRREAPRAAARLSPGIIPEYAAKRLLAEAGVPIPPGALATTLSEAVLVAERIGWPVALKVQSPALSHKSDAGAVVLNVGDKTSLESAWTKLMANVARASAALAVDGALVEKMAEPGTELILGARRDRDWGPVLALGLGGVFAELLHDVRLVAADCDAETIAAELEALKGAALLRGFRGSPARDVDAAARIARTLGRFVLAHPEITEIEINPLSFTNAAGAPARSMH